MVAREVHGHRRTAIIVGRAVAGAMFARQRLMRHAADEGFGAVDRIEHSDILGIGTLGAQFLTDDAVLREVCLLNAHRAASAAGSVAVT